MVGDDYPMRQGLPANYLGNVMSLPACQAPGVWRRRYLFSNTEQLQPRSDSRSGRCTDSNTGGNHSLTWQGRVELISPTAGLAGESPPALLHMHRMYHSSM